jgi:hypothetical protein
MAIGYEQRCHPFSSSNEAMAIAVDESLPCLDESGIFWRAAAWFSSKNGALNVTSGRE